MTTDPTTLSTTSAGHLANDLPQHAPSRLSDREARAQSQDDSDQQLEGLRAALGMARPVAPATLARLVEHIVKHSNSANVDLLEAQLRVDGWEQLLSPGETLGAVAARIHAYLESPQGVEMFNLFTRNVARTTGEMFD